MDEKDFVLSYLDYWMEGRKRPSHDELIDAYINASELYKALCSQDTKPEFEFGFVVEVENEFVYEEE